MSSRYKTVFTLTITALSALALTFSLSQGAAQSSGPPLSPGLAAGPAMERAPLLPAVTNAGTAFTYQGQLKSGGAPVNAICDFVFSLFDALTIGAQVGTNLTQTIAVTSGLFTTGLDFGDGAMTGDARWLANQVRCPTGIGTYTPLTPRQALTPAPMALALPGLYTLQNPFSPNLIGGYIGNFISPTVAGAAIGGGGQIGFINRVTADFGTVSGGIKNTASGQVAIVGGGYGNTASGLWASVGGGYSNAASGDYVSVGGGSANVASGSSSMIGGGDNNTASGDQASVGGGVNNIASGAGAFVGGGGYNGFVFAANKAQGGGSAIAGGLGNVISTTGIAAFIGGGQSNIASGQFATVPGGLQNLAQGDYSFAAGRQAKANNTGCFVWADSNATNLNCNTNNAFFVRASGGITMFSNAGATVGVQVPPGSGSWSTVSDKNMKANFANVDGRATLARVSALPISTWNYKTQDDSIRHIGPMAQDFAAAFNVGENNTTISVVDAQGVAFAAIQGLNQIVTDQRAQIGSQQGEIAQLKAHNAAMDARMAALERGAPAPAGGLPLPPALLIAGALALLGLGLTRRFGPSARRSPAAAGSGR